MINSNNQGYTDTVLMIRPAAFGYNAETAANNAFQSQPGASDEDPSRTAVIEFDSFVKGLRLVGVRVMVWQDTADVLKPDAVFPNNWVSFHQNGTVVTYPMFAENRRAERSRDLVDHFAKAFGFIHRLSLEDLEEDDIFLEGTGSMVLDREHRLCYACLGPRTNQDAVNQWCELMDYTSIVFHATDGKGQDIYHTNVVMAIGPEVVVICLESLKDPDERKQLVTAIESSGKKVLDISLDQMADYAGNMLFLRSSAGQSVLAVSARAWNALNYSQRMTLSNNRQVVQGQINVIESIGGGSVRCMLAEVFYPTQL